jgi:hypothetical protein
MIPVKPSNNQQNCNPISSNCVIWQGPDIACINLQKGDTVSDVTYKLAVELCDILDQTNLTSFDLSCFDPICPKPENFHDLIQFIIDKLCSLNNCCSGATPVVQSSSTAKTMSVASAQTTGNCPDCIITIAPCFQYTDTFGNNITTMNIADYAAAIGTKVCTLSTQFAALQTTVSNHGTRITNLENQLSSLVIPIPVVNSTCLYPSTSVQITTFCQALETQFCALRTATGLPASITSAVSKQCAGLDNSPMLSNPSQVMGLISGWVPQSSYSTAADAINNIWLTVCDMRAALQNVLNNCCNDAAICSTVSVDLSGSISGTTLSILFTGSAPTAFSDCVSGLSLVIKDKYLNTYQVTPVVISNLNGSAVTFNISTSGLQTWSDLDLTLNNCSVDSVTGLTCTSIKTAAVSNPLMPFTITPAPNTTYIDYTISNSASAVVSALTTTIYAYLYAADQTTIVGNATFVNDPNSTINQTFSGLTTATNYYIKCDVQIGTYIKQGTLQLVTTL